MNQKDSDEKAQQLGMMGDIYRKALLVVVCLGESSAETDEAMDCIHPLGKAVKAEFRAIESIGTLHHKGQQGEIQLRGLDTSRCSCVNLDLSVSG